MPWEVQSKIGTILSKGTNLEKKWFERKRRISAHRVNQESALLHRTGVHLRNWPLPAATADPRPVNAETLLCLIAEASSLVWTSWTWHAAYRRKLSVFPDADALQETKHVALLLLPEFFDVFVRLRVGSGFGLASAHVLPHIRGEKITRVRMQDTEKGGERN